MTKIAFIGLGNMGGPMAKNLVSAGYQVTGFDLIETAINDAKESGIKISKNAASAAVDAEILISMLPASQHVESLYLEEKLLKSIDPSTLIIDCSTIAPETSRKVSKEADALGLSMIDAPVSGGVAGAVAGTLTFIVGGKQ